MSVNAVDQTTGNTTPLAGNTNNLVGNLSALTTNTKSDAVGAINEVNANKQNATDNNLQTTDKTIVGGINELRSGLTDVEIAISTQGTTTLDFNDLTTDGRYWVDGTWTNGPGGEVGMLVVYAYSGYVTQALHHIDGTMHIRGYNAAITTWSPWGLVTTT